MLSRLRLKGFKSFADEAVDLNGLTLLVGANAAGKSNFLDAIRFLQGVALDMSLADVLRGRWEGGRQVWPGVRGGVSEVVKKGEGELLLESSWTHEGETITHTLGVEAGPHPRVDRERLASTAVGGYLFDTHGGALRDVEGRDQGASLRVVLERAGKGNSLTQTHSAGRSLLFQVKTEAPVSEDVGRVRDALARQMRNAFFLDITPSRMRDYTPKHSEQLGLEGENVSALTWSLCRDPEEKANLVDWLAELCAPELEDIQFAETELGDVMLVLVEAGGRRMPAKSLSDGTLRFLGQLIALRTAPEGSLLLIEEIENGLHPTRAHLLVEAMEAATATRDVQILATTHSPLVLNALSPEALNRVVLVARPPGSEGSMLRRLADLPGFREVASRRGIDRLIESGWLERAV